MDRKLKLAKLIKLEIKALDKAETAEGMLNLSQEIIRDAKELASLVFKEENTLGRKMKKYNQLTQHQKDLAADKALAVLVRLIVDGIVKPKLSTASQEFISWWLINMDKETAYQRILADDDVASELYPLAEDMAATALYPEKGEYVLNDIA